ncbi:MAG: hydrogenase iron-sulfur subunit [Planctomycetota bacterium]|nr:hydrogenase iron-sulfur subunit [Planctomycetota bacterium]
MERPEDKVVVFACNWCSYGGADTCGVSRFQYPPSARLIRTMCSARVSPNFVYYAFSLGAPVVLVSGCHFADCHYINANRNTVKRVQAMWDRLEKWGIRPQRLQLEWISAAEGERFARVMEAMENIRRTVTKEEMEFGKGAVKEYVEKYLKEVRKGDKVSVAEE